METRVYLRLNLGLYAMLRCIQSQFSYKIMGKAQVYVEVPRIH